MYSNAHALAQTHKFIIYTRKKKQVIRFELDKFYAFQWSRSIKLVYVIVYSFICPIFLMKLNSLSDMSFPPFHAIEKQYL